MFRDQASRLRGLGWDHTFGGIHLLRFTARVLGFGVWWFEG